jgi:hypothetical protein
METVRLRFIQEPSRVARLLEAFASSIYGLPEESYQIRDRSVLASVLQLLVIEAIGKQRAWCCWTDDHHVWLLTGEMSLPLSRERGAPVLQVNSYAEGGELTDAGFWVSDHEGGWRRCADASPKRRGR